MTIERVIVRRAEAVMRRTAVAEAKTADATDCRRDARTEASRKTRPEMVAAAGRGRDVGTSTKVWQQDGRKWDEDHEIEGEQV